MPTPEKERIAAFDTMVNALAECAQQFRVYEQLHRAKPDHAKADKNANYADRCENALQVAGYDLSWEDGRIKLYSPIRATPAPAPSVQVGEDVLEAIEVCKIIAGESRGRFCKGKSGYDWNWQTAIWMLIKAATNKERE